MGQNSGERLTPAERDAKVQARLDEVVVHGTMGQFLAALPFLAARIAPVAAPKTGTPAGGPNVAITFLTEADGTVRDVTGEVDPAQIVPAAEPR